MLLTYYFPTSSYVAEITHPFAGADRGSLRMRCLQIYLSLFPMLLLNLGLYIYECVKVSNQSSITLHADRDRHSGAAAEES